DGLVGGADRRVPEEHPGGDFLHLVELHLRRLDLILLRLLPGDGGHEEHTDGEGAGQQLGQGAHVRVLWGADRHDARCERGNAKGKRRSAFFLRFFLLPFSFRTHRLSLDRSARFGDWAGWEAVPAVGRKVPPPESVIRRVTLKAPVAGG